MPEHHHWTLTINYFTEVDIQEIHELIYLPMVDYWAYCIECCNKHHPHIHLSIHFKSSKTMNALLSHFTKRHRAEPVADSIAMHDYIRGYKDGKMKCSGCSTMSELVEGKKVRVNDYFTEGPLPENGKKKQPREDIKQKILEAIQSGMTIEDMDKNFPMYMLYHKDKILRWYRDHKPKEKTSFYQLCYEHDSITEWLDIFAVDNPAVITDLSQLELYENHDHILFLLDSEYNEVIKLLKLFARGMPIYYKKGYEVIKVYPKTFTVSFDGRLNLPCYKKI